jgi:hypothetical protein
VNSGDFINFVSRLLPPLDLAELCLADISFIVDDFCLTEVDGRVDCIVVRVKL